MIEEPLFELTDKAGNNRTVRIVKSYVDVGGANLRTAVADVVDVANGEQIRGIPLSRLIPVHGPGNEK